jgi:YtfJ family uncharacterized protein
MRQLFIALLLSVLSWHALSNSLVSGQPAPDMAIEERGELILEGDKVTYRPWRYQLLDGKIHVVNYMAATMGASKLNRPFTDRLQETLEKGSYHVTTILNLDDAMWGTTGFVVSEVKANKRKHPTATLVLDEEAVGISAWQLENDNSAIVVFDAAGKVRYIKQGAMSETEIEQAVEMIRQFIENGPS